MSYFIAIEGPECGGKSTQILRLASYLTEQGKSIVTTREPGGTPLGEAVREIFLAKHLDVSPTAEILLMLAQRRQHWEDVIAPALDAGQWVISDRFHLSTIVYQGYGRRLSRDFIAQLATAVLPKSQPDMTVVLDLPADLSLQRLANRGQSDRLESGAIDFYERIRQGFLAEVEKNPINHRLVDATNSIDTVGQSIQEAIQALL